VEVLVRRSLQLSLFAVVLIGLVGGTLAYFVAQKSVTLTVDGQPRTVATYAGTVGEVLDEEGLEPAAHDVVLPGPGQALADGDAVVVNRARPLELTVDGVSREVYVTALSVDEALAQLGYRADGLVLSASRSERLPLDGMQLTITTPKEIVLVSDGQERVVTTTAATAGDLLAEQGIALSETDRTSLYLGQGLLNRMRLQVFRVQVSETTVTDAIPHERVETPDPEALEGDETVTQEGVDGEQVTTVRVTVVDGVETARETLSTSVTREPVTEQVAVGSKPRPANSPSADGLNWAALAQCESGGRPNAVSSTGKYHGLYQFSVATWQAVGGTGLPSQASPDEQTYRAQLLYQRSGAGQWPHCGKNL
jgi:resuscitation-promoting factor RpfB